MELTKQQRHEVYKLAHRLYYMYMPGVGLCYCLRMALGAHRYPCNKYSRVPVLLPEIIKHNPNPDHAKKCDYWFRLEETAPRIAILEACIEETKPE